MPALSSRQGTPFSDPLTLPTDEVEAETFDNALLVHGAFGTTGVYPLDHAATLEDGRAALHCSLYFVRLAPGETARERNPVVIEKTAYTLRYQGRTLVDEAICTACENPHCPPNRNPAAYAEGQPPGRLILSLT